MLQKRTRFSKKLGMSEVQLKAKRSCFISKPSPKDGNKWKPAQPPLRSKQAQMTPSTNEANPAAKATSAEKKPISVNIDSSDGKKNEKQTLPNREREKPVQTKRKSLPKNFLRLELLRRKSVLLQRKTSRRCPVRDLLGLRKRRTLRFTTRLANSTSRCRSNKASMISDP